MAKLSPDIETKRLRLRNISLEDAELIVNWRSDPEIFKYFGIPKKITLSEHIDWYNRSYLANDNRYDYMAIIKENKRSAGIFGLKKESADSKVAEVSYITAPDCKGQGIASEAVLALVEYAFDKWNCNNVEAYIHKSNNASIKFIEKLGFLYRDSDGEFKIYSTQRRNLCAE